MFFFTLPVPSASSFLTLPNISDCKKGIEHFHDLFPY